MCHTAGTSFCTSPARANVAVPTIVQSAWTDGHAMQHQALTSRSVHTPQSDRRPRQVPLALSEPPSTQRAASRFPSPGKDLTGPHDNPRHGTTNPGVHPQEAPRKSERPLSQVGTTPQFTWMQYIPQRLQRRLDWTPVALDKWAKPVILLLYAGKDDAGSLDPCLHAYHSWISPFIRAIDTRRDPGPMGQDMLAPEPYNTLCTLAAL